MSSSTETISKKSLKSRFSDILESHGIHCTISEKGSETTMDIKMF
jgi:hypothetical protein